MTEEKINIKGLNIYYKIFGEEKTSLPADRRVLILHGWGSNSEKWQKVGRLLAENGIKVIIPDLPGFGQSDKPPKAWCLDDYCNFIKEFIENLNLEKFYLSGHSFGGELAVKYSLRFPEKINKLFLLDASCIRTRDLKKKLLYIISKIFRIFSFSSFLRKAFYKFVVGKSDYLSVKGVMRDTYLKVIAEDLSGVLSQIKIPTVIIWGEKDDITPLNDARIISQRIKNSRLEIIPDVGHNPHLENPEELSKLITQNL